ncbi:hypothetical protein [uncultured Sunxiuqinia sp.]|uniref:hypothetical protein n=1 Tax=uncultured Sunxiuqinia sp. TaxID=1573825 RepID=UPI002AA94183|nr:hypothetical protein [uncultured Sunxiuqinia sp.]
MSKSVKTKKKNKIDKKVWDKVFVIVYVLILVVSFFKTYDRIFDKKINLGGDNAAYYILGNAIESGQGFTNIHTKEKVAHNHFPPGYPAVIAAVSTIFTNDILFIKKVNGFFLLASIGLLFLILYELSGSIHVAFITSLISLLNYHLLSYSVIMMSEIPFLFFSLLSIWLVTKLNLNKVFYKNPLFPLLLVTIAITYYIRSTGLALVIGIVAYLAFKKKWAYIATLIGSFFLAIFPWYLRNKELGGNAYVKQLIRKNPYRPELGQMEFGDWFTRFWHNLERYITREVPSGTFNFIPNANYKEAISSTEWVIGLAIVAIMLFGLFRTKKYFNLIFFYLASYFGILLLWPEVWYGVRFMLPLIPLFTFLFIHGIIELLTLTAQRILKLKKPQVVQIAVVILVLISSSSYASKAVDLLEKKAESTYPDKYKNYFELAEWIKANAPDSAVTCCRKGQLFFLFSNKYVTGYKNTLDTEEQIEYLKSKGTDYVILDQLGYSSTGRYLLPAIKKYPLKFRVIKQVKNPDTYLMKFQPDQGYWGEWKDDKREGKGTFAWDNGQRFVGEFKNNMRNGEGILFYPNGNQLEGTWVNDTLDGATTLKSKDGKIIEQSIFENNQKIRNINQK